MEKSVIPAKAGIPAGVAFGDRNPGSFLTLHYRMAGPDGKDIISTFDGKPATFNSQLWRFGPAAGSRLRGDDG